MNMNENFNLMTMLALLNINPDVIVIQFDDESVEHPIFSEADLIEITRGFYIINGVNIATETMKAFEIERMEDSQRVYVCARFGD